MDIRMIRFGIKIILLFLNLLNIRNVSSSGGPAEGPSNWLAKETSSTEGPSKCPTNPLQEFVQVPQFCFK